MAVYHEKFYDEKFIHNFIFLLRYKWGSSLANKKIIKILVWSMEFWFYSALYRVTKEFSFLGEWHLNFNLCVDKYTCFRLEAVNMCATINHINSLLIFYADFVSKNKFIFRIFWEFLCAILNQLVWQVFFAQIRSEKMWNFMAFICSILFKMH